MPSRAEVMQALRAADAAGAEDDARRLAAMYDSLPPDGSESAAPPEAPAEVVPNSNAGAYSTASGVPDAVTDYLSGLQAAKRNNPTTGMSPFETVASGAGKNLVGLGRGARQLWNYASGDEEELAKLNAEEEEARRLDEPLMATTGGKVGYYGTELASYALPASKIAKIPAIVKGGRAALAAAEMGLGGVQGALRPTVEGESRGVNTAVGGALGLGAAYAAPIARGAYRAYAHVPILGAPARALIVSGEQKATAQAALAAREAAQARALAAQTANREAKAAAQAAKAQEKAAAQALKEQQAAVRKRAGDVIEKYVGQGSGSIKVTPEMAQTMRRLSTSYKEDLPEFFHRAAEQVNVPGAATRVPLQRIHELKSQLGGLAREKTAARESGLILHQAERAVTNSLLSSLPKRKASLLKQAFEEYASGVAKVPRRGVKPLPQTAAPAAPAAPIPPGKLAQAKTLISGLPANVQKEFEGMGEASKRQFIRSVLFPLLDSEAEDEK